MRHASQSREAIMRRLITILPLFILTLLCFVAPVHGAGESHTSGPPNAMEFRADTAIWAAVVFAILLAVLWSKAWGPILEGLQKREETIRTSLEEAKLVRADMVTMKSEFHKELAEAHQQIPKLMEEARKKAEEMSNDMRAKAMADIQQERGRLRNEMEIAKDQAIKELWEKAAQVATLIAANAIGRSLTDEDHRRLLDEAMLEMGRATHN
jgi:F-type H+-transporting ATPase subunit b